MVWVTTAGLAACAGSHSRQVVVGALEIPAVFGSAGIGDNDSVLGMLTSTALTSVLLGPPEIERTLPAAVEAGDPDRDRALRITGATLLIGGLVTPLVFIPTGLWLFRENFELDFAATTPNPRGDRLALGGLMMAASGGLAPLVLIPAGVGLLAAANRSPRRPRARAVLQTGRLHAQVGPRGWKLGLSLRF